MVETTNPAFNSRTSIIKSVNVTSDGVVITATPKFFDMVNTKQFGATDPVDAGKGVKSATLPFDNLSETLCCIYETAVGNQRSGISPSFIMEVADDNGIKLDVPGIGHSRY